MFIFHAQTGTTKRQIGFLQLHMACSHMCMFHTGTFKRSVIQQVGIALRYKCPGNTLNLAGLGDHAIWVADGCREIAAERRGWGKPPHNLQTGISATLPDWQMSHEILFTPNKPATSCTIYKQETVLEDYCGEVITNDTFFFNINEFARCLASVWVGGTLSCLSTLNVTRCRTFRDGHPIEGCCQAQFRESEARQLEEEQQRPLQTSCMPQTRSPRRQQHQPSSQPLSLFGHLHVKRRLGVLHLMPCAQSTTLYMINLSRGLVDRFVMKAYCIT